MEPQRCSMEQAPAPQGGPCAGHGHASSCMGGAPTAEQAVVQEAAMPPARDLGDLVIGPEASHWSRLLLKDHLTSGCKLALFGTCAAGRDNVLVTTDHATFRLTCTEPQVSQARLQVAKQALQTRGKLRTTLQLTTSDAGLLSAALEGLAEGTTWLDELRVQCSGALPSTALATLGRCFPHLRALHVHAPTYELPSPELFPKLKELSIQAPQSDQDVKPIFRTTAPYIKQLTHLSFPSCHNHPTPLPLLLSPGNVGTHLRSLETTTLHDTLLGLVLECAPALTHLKVQTLQLASTVHAQSKVSWQRLEVTDLLHLSSLTCLPAAAGMRLIVPGAVICDVSNPQAVEAVAAAVTRFQQVAGGQPASKGCLVVMRPAQGMQAHGQSFALQAGIKLLRAMVTPGKAPAAQTAPLLQPALQALPAAHWQPAPQLQPAAQQPAPQAQLAPQALLALLAEQSEQLANLEALAEAAQRGFANLRNFQPCCHLDTQPVAPQVVAPSAVALAGWTITAPWVAQLFYMPDWQKLILVDSKWPAEEASNWATLLGSVPFSYREVVFHTGELSSSQIESICLGAPVLRRHFSPLHVKFPHGEAAVVEAIRHKMQGSFPNVTVSCE